MSYKKQLEKMGATPGKLALIGVLALVLVIVIFKQLPENGAKYRNAGTTVATQQPVPADQAGGTKSAPSAEQQSEEVLWPEFNVVKTLANDPFAAPGWAEPEEPEELVTTDTNNESSELAELQQQGASIVVIAEGRKSASIGDQRVRVGDILDGYKITDITTQGVLLNKLDPR